MPYDPHIHHRRSTRLKGYNYTAEGAYFVTICTFAKEWVFGEVQNNIMVTNPFGQIAADCWTAIPSHFPHIELDEFVIMPNHMHGILLITEPSPTVGAQHAAPSTSSSPSSMQPHAPSTKNAIPLIKSGSLSAAIRSYKSAVTRQVNNLHHASGEHFWQRNFHDHIIRNETSLNYLRAYVLNNPTSWSKDIFHTKL